MKIPIRYERMNHILAMGAPEIGRQFDIQIQDTIVVVFSEYVKSQLHMNILELLNLKRDIFDYKKAYDYLVLGELRYQHECQKVLNFFYEDITAFLVHSQNNFKIEVKDDSGLYERRKRNIEYKEDRWFTTITPIYYKDRIVGTNNFTDLKSTRIRDKWIKIRIKYTGEKLVVINAIQSLLRLSYA